MVPEYIRSVWKRESEMLLKPIRCHESEMLCSADIFSKAIFYEEKTIRLSYECSKQLVIIPGTYQNHF